MSVERQLLVILGNQLFAPELLPSPQRVEVYMAEDYGLCTCYKHHKQKLALFLGAMRCHADTLRAAGYRLHYQGFDLDAPPLTSASSAAYLTYPERLMDFVRREAFGSVCLFEIEDRDFESALLGSLRTLDVPVTLLESPMFLTPRKEFADYLASVRRPFMAKFYERQRKRLNILLDGEGQPRGGKWSYDADNRKALPRTVDIPSEPGVAPAEHIRALIPWINEHFSHHPGTLSEQHWWLPATRSQSLEWLEVFLRQRLRYFGDYEDAISTRGTVLFHSVLSVPLNMGLLTPREVLDRTLGVADELGVPLNSLEGFVRQIIGWREFIRGIDRHYGEQQAQSNAFGHTRQLADCWYQGNTGIPILDHTIKTLQDYGWCHHIERLMVLGNLMLLCEIEPRAAYRFFMEYFVDSSDWVMGPNVYGMALFSDGGIFATKPYISGSNYLVKMSNASKGPWCDIIDGLYWRFVDQKRDFLKSNPRLNMMLGTFDKMSSERRNRIFSAAEDFLAKATTPGA